MAEGMTLLAVKNAGLGLFFKRSGQVTILLLLDVWQLHIWTTDFWDLHVSLTSCSSFAAVTCFLSGFCIADSKVMMNQILQRFSLPLYLHPKYRCTGRQDCVLDAQGCVQNCSPSKFEGTNCGSHEI